MKAIKHIIGRLTMGCVLALSPSDEPSRGKLLVSERPGPAAAPIQPASGMCCDGSGAREICRGRHEHSGDATAGDFAKNSAARRQNAPSRLPPIQFYQQPLKQHSKRRKRQPRGQGFRQTSPRLLPLIFVTQRVCLLTYRSRWPSKARSCWNLRRRLVRRMQ